MVIQVPQALRYLRLFDSTWRLVDMPQRIDPIIEVIHSRGLTVPSVSEVTCACGYVHVMDWDRYYFRTLPATITERNDGPEQMCWVCGEAYQPPHDTYLACTECGAKVEVPMRETGPVDLSVVTGYTLVPDTLELLFVASETGSFTMGIDLPRLQDDTGADLFPVTTAEMRYEPGELSSFAEREVPRQERITLEVRPVGDPHEIMRKLQSAVFGDTPPAKTVGHEATP